MEYPRRNRVGEARHPHRRHGDAGVQTLARIEAKNRGIADLPLALILHPLGGIDEDEVVRKADLVIEAVVRALTKS